jgi:hypothetical protein
MIQFTLFQLLLVEYIWDSLVGIATGYGLDGPEIEARRG